ncbi:MAG: phosphoglycerate kinase, partial [Candidatus Cloacimonetes bacterium]|nr:phosphoglycerate kinase [Candidatus Cloacimonadota bacterium]
DGSTRPIILKDYSSGDDLGEILDAAPQSFEDARVREVFMNAGTIFVNAVMGFMPLFWEGSSALYSLISQNKRAQKLFGGGDTIQEFSSLLPQIFQSAAQDPNYYFFTGGGAILNAIEQGSPYGMKPVAALIK